MSPVYTMPTWLSRLLWMIAQAAAIGGLTWMLMGQFEPNPPPLPDAKASFFAVGIAVLLVAFATGLITRLWDLSLSALARRRTAGRQR